VLSGLFVAFKEQVVSVGGGLGVCVTATAIAVTGRAVSSRENNTMFIECIYITHGIFL
jgi:hypothetical protein